MSLCVNLNLQKSLKYMFLKLIYLKLVTFCLTITLLPELLACAQFFFIKMRTSQLIMLGPLRLEKTHAHL